MTEIDFAYPDPSRGTEDFQETAQPSEAMADEYIDMHFQENLTLETLARLSGLTPNYFSSLFSKVSGIKLWDYINSRRIEAAMQLLKNESNLNIIEIAAQCGFNNTANFNKAFKKAVGITPGEYRSNDDII